MDPLFTYLNRIPGVLSVQRYVDDTTIVGDAQDLHWLQQSAGRWLLCGFVHCWICDWRPQVLSWTLRHSDSLQNCVPTLKDSPQYGTLHGALKAKMKPGYNTVVARLSTRPGRTRPSQDSHPASHVVALYTYQQLLEILNGRDLHQLGAFATCSCSCKSRSNVLTNWPLGNGNQGPLVGINPGWAPGLWSWKTVSILCIAGYAKKLSDRLKSFSRPTLSVVARCTGFNTFILSVMPHSMSPLCPILVSHHMTSTDYDRLPWSLFWNGIGSKDLALRFESSWYCHLAWPCTLTHGCGCWTLFKRR